ncbi:hypothetical protein BH24CHL7_BH24CHL7_16220 [soil metagenome]
MSVERRSLRRFVTVALAVPVILAVYAAVFVSRLGRTLRLTVAGLAGATVIGSVYADAAIRHSPVRATPLRAAGVMALAVTLLGASVAPTPTLARKPVEAVIAAAQSYVGTPYRLGAEGPNRVDCSGLVFRVFADAGELPRVSGKRLRAVGYFRWFSSRGLASRTEGRRGDLVIYDDGDHMGIYLGGGKVLSALTSGVTVHGLRAISVKFTAFLNVQWGKGDGTGGEGKNEDQTTKDGNKGKKTDNNEREGKAAGADGETVDGEGEAVAGSTDEAPQGRLLRGVATGTLNLRRAPGPDEKITGIVGKASEFKVLGTGSSPSGALWLNVRMANGKAGWIWAHWTRIMER